MTEEAPYPVSPPSPSSKPDLLGPFLGYVTPHSIKVWLHLEGGPNEVFVTVHTANDTGIRASVARLVFKADSLWTDCDTIKGLSPDTRYFYRLWTNEACSIPLDLQGLKESELCFRTLPIGGDAQVDFLLVSCHNPLTAKADGFDGYAVWADIPQIISNESNKSVRFALLIGDQIYADDWHDRILAARTGDERIKLYLDCYRSFWSNIHYRRVLCSLPAVLMWDDHDITDGWGSTLDSFLPNSQEIRPEWQELFGAARTTFSIMQNTRNPAPLSATAEGGFDYCFRIGKWGFVVLDLRSNRNLLKNRILAPEQLERVKAWVTANVGMEALFVVSTVVFSHGAPVIDDLAVSLWRYVMCGFDFFAQWSKWGKGLSSRFTKSLGDIRDDIRDSWGVRENAAQTDMVLDYLFDLQNGTNPMSVVVMCGDIHTSGYANIYSNDSRHAGRSSIPHITCSAVAYSPFNWLLESVYRHASRTVALGELDRYSSQISHHFCSRSVAVLSLRPGAAGQHLKVKYYLEGFPEPKILLFDLDRVSHRENITWVAQQKVSDKDYAPSIKFDVQAELENRAQLAEQALDWRNSIVDLMKLLGIDSSLGARKRLAQQWGYTGTLNGSAEMNIWLHQQVIDRLAANKKSLPATGV